VRNYFDHQQYYLFNNTVMLLKTIFLITFLLGSFLEMSAQKRINLADALVWKESPDIYRVYHHKSFYLTDTKGRILLDLSQYKSVGPINDQSITVQDKKDNYGLLGIGGQVILQTEWKRISKAINGFVLAEKENGSKIKEDRGNGLKWYADTDYYLCRTNGEVINFKLDQATFLGDKLIGQDEFLNQFMVDLALIRSFYAHPMMKAIEQINGQHVMPTFKSDTSEIVYQLANSGEVVYSIKIPTDD